MRLRWMTVCGLGVGLALTSMSVGAAGTMARKYAYDLLDHNGYNRGRVTFTQKPGEPVKMHIELETRRGDHAVHIHENAVCDAPDFKGAGGHFNPDKKQHGWDNPMGHHNGDLPKNVTVGDDGTGEATFEMPAISLNPNAPNSIFANGGTSVVVHEKPDDMKTDPTGNAGNRIACAVVKR
jgi:Cu-Zn family superoxide dismutase